MYSFHYVYNRIENRYKYDEERPSGDDISIFSYKEGISMLNVNHFVDVKLVGFKRNGNGEIFLQEQQLFEFLDLLGQ